MALILPSAMIKQVCQDGPYHEKEAVCRQNGTLFLYP